MSRPVLREWQKKCGQAILADTLAALSVGRKPRVNVEACVGSGKSMMMADTGHELLFGELAEVCPADFNVYVAPNTTITGSSGGADHEPYGILGALLNYGIWPVERITVDRMAGLSVRPELKTNDAAMILGVAAVFTYQYFAQERVQATLRKWAEEGLRIAIHYDEIHHVPQLGSAWSEAVDCINRIAVFVSYWSGTWFRTDRRPIKDQATEDKPELTFCYPYADGIRDGWVRPVSFWVPDMTARTFDKWSGTLIDERPVSAYLEEIPPVVRREMFNPDGRLVEAMIRRADTEMGFRRGKYPDAGCLVVCPPGFHDEEGDDDPERQNRIAGSMCCRVRDLTGKRAILFLNGDPVSRVREYRESDVEYLVAVNRVTEGADIPRLRMLACPRDLSGSQLLFEQVLGRIIRRRKEDDEEPALAIIPPIHAMCEFARQVAIAEKGVTPKQVKLCERCGRSPCSCPCPRCGKRRPCRCPCRRCGQRPCVCRTLPLEVFAQLEGVRDAHITQGTDIEDRFAARAGAIRERVEACHHRDLAFMAFVLQSDEEISGPAGPGRATDPEALPPEVVATAATWANLRDGVPLKVRHLGRFFRHEENPYRAAWRHVNRRFFPQAKWKDVCDDPSRLTFDKLREVHAYLDRALRGNML